MPCILDAVHTSGWLTITALQIPLAQKHVASKHLKIKKPPWKALNRRQAEYLQRTGSFFISIPVAALQALWTRSTLVLHQAKKGLAGQERAALTALPITGFTNGEVKMNSTNYHLFWQHGAGGKGARQAGGSSRLCCGKRGAQCWRGELRTGTGQGRDWKHVPWAGRGALRDTRGGHTWVLLVTSGKV